MFEALTGKPCKINYSPALYFFRVKTDLTDVNCFPAGGSFWFHTGVTVDFGGESDQNEDCHSSVPRRGCCGGSTRRFHAVLLCFFKAARRDELLTVGLVEANEVTRSRGRNRKPKREWQNLLLDILGKVTLCATAQAKTLWSGRPGKYEPRRASFSLVCFISAPSLVPRCCWEALVLSSQILPDNFCRWTTSGHGALACGEVCEHTRMEKG